MDFSIADGFVEISEDVGDMIKFLANEPSAGLFYVQQHSINAVPRVVNMRNNVVAKKSQEVIVHTQDLEDSITMVRSIKDCGFPVVDEMIREIKDSLAIMSTKQPRRGLVEKSNSGFLQGRAQAWGSTAWIRYNINPNQDSKRTGNFLATLFSTAKEKADSFEWPPLNAKATTNPDEILQSTPNPLRLDTSDVETEELPVSSQGGDVLQANESNDWTNK